MCKPGEFIILSVFPLTQFSFSVALSITKKELVLDLDIVNEAN